MNLWLRYSNDKMYDRFYSMYNDETVRIFLRCERRFFLIDCGYYSSSYYTKHLLKLPEFLEKPTLLSKGFLI